MPQAADILSDPEINQAYEDVRSDKSETTWMVLKVGSLPYLVQCHAQYVSIHHTWKSRNANVGLMQTQYASATSDNLKLAATGTGDIAEMTESLADDEAAYAYVRMKLGNDEYSERVKFAFVVWAGMIFPFPFLTLRSHLTRLPYHYLRILNKTIKGKGRLLTPVRSQHQSHAQGQNVVSIWAGQAGD
jgi:hypothetical protein